MGLSITTSTDRRWGKSTRRSDLRFLALKLWACIYSTIEFWIMIYCDMINYSVKENNNIEYNNDTTIIWSCEKAEQRDVWIRINNQIWCCPDLSQVSPITMRCSRSPMTKSFFSHDSQFTWCRKNYDSIIAYWTTTFYTNTHQLALTLFVL